jgi:hypothetical protein
VAVAETSAKQQENGRTQYPEQAVVVSIAAPTLKVLENFMDEETSIRIGKLFDDTLIEGYGKNSEERRATIGKAREIAINLCQTRKDSTIVECRALEAQLNSAIMNMQRVEAGEVRNIIAKSAFFRESRRKEMLTMADRFLAAEN